MLVFLDGCNIAPPFKRYVMRALPDSVKLWCILLKPMGLRLTYRILELSPDVAHFPQYCLPFVNVNVVIAQFFS